MAEHLNAYLGAFSAIPTGHAVCVDQDTPSHHRSTSAYLARENARHVTLTFHKPAYLATLDTTLTNCDAFHATTRTAFNVFQIKKFAQSVPSDLHFRTKNVSTVQTIVWSAIIKANVSSAHLDFLSTILGPANNV